MNLTTTWPTATATTTPGRSPRPGATAGWSLLASFTQTWRHEAALGTGNDFTPNAFVNAERQPRSLPDVAGQGQRHVQPATRFPAWSPWSAPVRHTVRAHVRAGPQLRETRPSRRSPVMRTDTRHSLVDLPRRKRSRPGCAGDGILHVYNLLNTNAAQTVTTSSGALAAADGDHRATHSPHRRASGVVAAAFATPSPALSQTHRS